MKTEKHNKNKPNIIQLAIQYLWLNSTSSTVRVCHICLERRATFPALPGQRALRLRDWKVFERNLPSTVFTNVRAGFLLLELPGLQSLSPGQPKAPAQLLPSTVMNLADSFNTKLLWHATINSWGSGTESSSSSWYPSTFFPFWRGKLSSK